MPNNSSAVSDDASSGSGSGGSGGCGGGGGGSMLKKGPWTAAEDAILMEYVKKHGEGNWNAVQKNSGLSRCGKSCRLRWANHLRPNLKKGSFSPEEERLILELHSKLGNKWARMAAQLPGRTDNEIKNYWNTRVKRRLRSGLPLYPQEIERQAAVYHMQQSNHHHQPSHHSSPSPSSPLPFSSLHHQKPNFGSQSSFFDPINFSSLNRQTIPQSQVHHGYKRFRGSNVGFTNPFSTPSSSSSSTSTLLNQNFTSQLLPPPHLQFNSTSFELNPPPPILRPFEPDAMVPPCSSFSMKLELPSSQLPQPVATASAACTAAVLGISNDLIPPSMARSNSGLLDDMLKEAQAMESEEEGRKEGILQSQEEKDGLDGFLSHAPPCGSVFSESPVTPSLGSARHWDGSSFAHSSMGVKMKKEQPDEINSLDHDDDLSSFFNIGPSTLLVSDLYNDGSGSGSGSGGGGEMSNGQSSVVTDEDIGLEMPLQLPPSSSLSTTTPTTAAGNAGDHDWTIDAWNNMPEMC